MRIRQWTGTYLWSFCLLTVTLLASSEARAQSPDDPVADAGGPYVAYEDDVVDGTWAFTLDGSGSTPGDAGDPVTTYQWDVECVGLYDTFDGTEIDTDAWYTARATQNDAITVTGTSSWGSGHVFSKDSIFREGGKSVEGQVTNSGGYAMWGLKHNNTNFSYSTMPYAIYFRSDGRLYIYEDAASRGQHGPFAFGITYDVRIELKPTSGARYYIRQAGATDWTLLYNSGHSSASEFLVGISVYSGTHVMDNIGPITMSVSYGELVDCSVAGEGEVTLTVTDSAGRTGSDTAEIIIEGEAPFADAGGPYEGLGGISIQFDGTGSSDDVGIARYEWDFGDATTGEGPEPSHTYSDLGTFEVTLTVYDQAGHVGTDTTTVDVYAAVVCVPWQYDSASGTEIPHDTWDGKSIRLKGVYFGPQPASELTYTWDFGDGSAPVSGTVTNKRVIEVSHVYSESPGAMFTAELTVEDAEGNLYSDIYRVIVREESLDVEVNVAVDEGLWYLHKQQASSGRWTAYSSFYASATSSAIHAFEINGHQPGGEVGQDPYVETVEKGFDYLFTLLTTYGIGTQPYGDPDSNGNGIGISVNSGRAIYEGGSVMDALAASGTPDRIAQTGSTGIVGRTYRGILQDMIDQYAWGQYDSGSARGGWRYGWNQHPDNSACQWAAIGCLGARDAFGLDAPGWVKDQNEIWLGYSQHSSGFYGYTSTNNSGWGLYATTSSGLVQLAWDGIETTDDRWIRAENWIANRWSSFLGNRTGIYAWYSFAKAMRLALPPVTTLSATGLDWYHGEPNGLARYLVNIHNSDGGWNNMMSGYIRRNMGTAWAIVILNPTLFTLAPVADAGGDVIWGFDWELDFDGSGSRHLDTARTLVQYEWDFDGDGTYDYIGVDPVASYTYVFDAGLDYPIVYQARLRVTDDADPPQTDVDTRAVTITEPPHPPIAVAGGPYTVTLGFPFTPDGTGSFDIDPDDFMTRYEWDFDGSDGYDFDNPDADCDTSDPDEPCQVTWMYTEPGEYNIGLRVWDDGVLNLPDYDPLASQPDFAVVYVVTNEPPVADANGPYQADECQPLMLDGSASFDPNGDPIIYSWDLDGDGAEDSTEPALTHTWPEDGEYAVYLTVSDTLLDSEEVSAAVVVDDTGPSVGLSGPQAVEADLPATFSAAVNSPCDELVSIDWDWDYTGSFTASGDQGSAQTHVYTAQGDYTVAVLVTDADGSTALATLAIEVVPSPTTLRSAETLMTVRYSRRTYNRRTGRHYARAYVFNMSDTPVSGPIVVVFDEFVPPEASVYQPDGQLPDGRDYIDFSNMLTDNQLPPGGTVGPKVIAWSNAGGRYFNFVSIPYVLNAAPRITSQPVAGATEGQMYTYQVAAEDANGDPMGFGVAQGPADMTINPSTGLVAWRPPQDGAGAYDVTVTVTDGYDSGMAQQSYTLTVSEVNIAPQITSTPETSIIRDEDYSYQVEALDLDGDPLGYGLEIAPSGMTTAAST